jgi:tetratricopeptide (TPR) repeat protein
MKVRRVSFAFVSAALLAAFATSCGTAYANSPEANTVLARKAYATLQSGDAKAAIGEYSDAIASEMLEPEMLTNALLNRALAHQQLADQQSAVKDYDAALATNVMAPALRSTALYNRGLALQKLGNISRAVEDFTASLLINPKFAQAFYSRANALRDSGQLLFALSDYERALRYGHPDKAKVHYGSATTYLALKRPLDAKREFGIALQLNPDFGQARAQLVMLGDENAKLETAGADPILTGSVGSFAGGTEVTKPGLPKAVEPPTSLQAAFENAPKKVAEQLPVIEEEFVEAPTAKAPEAVALEQVPDLPPPAKKPVQVAEAKPADEEQISDAAPAIQTGWAVQIASAANEDAAWSTWKKMQSRHKVLKSKEASVVKADLGAKGIFYRVRFTGYEDQASAKKACASLKAGGVSCYISKAGG